MTALYIILGIVGFVLFSCLLVNCVIVPIVIFKILLVRTKPEKWSRNCSWDNEEQKRMFALGEEWGEKYKDFHRQVSVTSDGFKLVGEYFDFGCDRAVIIVSGRMETCVYSYYFAEPYRKMGYNVLAIDNRSHGLSEGRYNTVGMLEYRDLLKWSAFLHDECHVKSVWFHGICIGSATALNALTAKDAPDYLAGLTNDGMYLHFGDMLEKRIKERKHAPQPTTEIILLLIKLVSGKNPKKYSPVNCIGEMKKPMLFLYSKEDIYSTPADIGQMYEKCGSEKKQIVWLEKGIHSHVRINAVEKYDGTIEEFLKENQPEI